MGEVAAAAGGGLQDCPGRARVPRRVIAAPGRARRGVVLDGGGRPRGDGTGRNRRFRRRRATVSVSPSVGERRRPATAAQRDRADHRQSRHRRQVGDDLAALTRPVLLAMIKRGATGPRHSEEAVVWRK